MSRDWQEQLQLEQEHEEQQVLDGIANLHEEEALKLHKEENDAITNQTNQRKAS